VIQSNTNGDSTYTIFNVTGVIITPIFPSGFQFQVQVDYIEGTAPTTGELCVVSFSRTGATGISSLSLNLPVPKVMLLTGFKTIETWSGPLTNTINGTLAKLFNAPTVIVQDFEESIFIPPNYVYLEAVFYRRKARNHGGPGGGQRRSGYIVPSSWADDGGTYWPVAWPSNFWTRTGSHTFGSTYAPYNINRPNHIPVNNNLQSLPAWEVLYGRYMYWDVAYADAGTGSVNTLNTLIPINGKRVTGKNVPTNRYAYSPFYTPTYIAFRYILYNSTYNDGRGQIVSGPLSRVIKVSHADFPFEPDYVRSNLYGIPVANINPAHVAENLQCWFETRLP
jgi:hypothetical protein